MNLKNVRALARIVDLFRIKCYLYVKLPWTNALNQFESDCLRSQAMNEETPRHGDRKEIAVLPDDPLATLNRLHAEAGEINAQLRRKLERLPQDQWSEGWSISPEGEVQMPIQLRQVEEVLDRFQERNGER